MQPTGLDFQKIQTAHTTQEQKSQWKNGQKTLTDISPKKIYR